MDDAVLRAMARWPDVPSVYGWLCLDRRGNWLLRDGESGGFGRITRPALREYIGRNYACDARGCWYFQNGPQRVYVSLHYTPWVVRYVGDALHDHCGRPTRASATLIDEEGSVLFAGEYGVALLDDRELDRFSTLVGDGWTQLPRVRKAEVSARFGFVSDPSDSLR